MQLRRAMLALTALLQACASGSAAITAPASSAANTRFDRTLELQGIRFRVSCANAGSLNTLEIIPTGLEVDRAPIVRTVDGTVSGAEIADLDADGSPELYVYVTSAGSGSYGSLVAYAVNGRRSLSKIFLPPVTEDAAAAAGYRGHDEFAVAGDRLIRRFPIYRDADSNAQPTGGTREIRYRLVPGEAGWQLAIAGLAEH